MSLTTVLNSILERTLRDQPGSDPDIIFVRNYPLLIQSSSLNGTVNPKPAIISVSPSVLRGWISNSDLLKNFEDLRTVAAKGIAPSDTPRSWSQIDQFVEVKKHRAKLSADFLGECYSRLGLTNITLGMLLNISRVLSDFLAGSQSNQTTGEVASGQDAVDNGTLPFLP